MKCSTINKKLAGIILLLVLTINITGCSGLASWLAVADSSLASAAAILKPVNPRIAENLSIAGALTHDVYDAYVIYDSASAADKSTALGRTRVALSAAQQKMNAILADARANPEVSGYVVAYISVANVVLVAISNRLPKLPAGARTAIAGPTLPLPPVNVKSPEQLKAWFDQEVVRVAAGQR